MQKIIKHGLSLRVQIYSLIIGLTIASFVGRLYLNVENTRVYFQEQMSSHAQDAATSLGLSISPYMAESDRVIVETMMAAIFDSGYYASMTLSDTQGNVLIERHNPATIESVPNWFIDLFPLSAPERSSEVNDGWHIAGVLNIKSHAGVSYFQLWQYTLNSLYSSLLLLFASLVVAHLILRALFKPLSDVENQAKAVTQKHFVMNERIPFTTELRTVTAAINNMVANLQKTFDSLTKQTEKLTKEAYIDKLTECGNRRAFDNYFSADIAELKGDDTHTICLVNLPSLQHINNELGYVGGDEYVVNVKNMLQIQFSKYNDTTYYRLSGGSFAIAVRFPLSFIREDIEQLTMLFKQNSAERFNAGFAEISATSYDASTQKSDLLSHLDTSITFAHVPKTATSDLSENFSVAKWRSMINEIIDKGDVSFSFQPIKSKDSQTTAEYFEVFVRFLHNGQQVNNGHLFAMAERLGLTVELDKKLIREFTLIKEYHPNKVFALNLSREAIYSPQLIQWLTMYSEAKPCLRHNLIFEVKEAALICDIEQTALTFEKIKALGIGICVEHFGASLSSFKYLQGLDIDYVKIDGSYIQDLVTNQQNNFFISTITTLCHGLGIKVIACLIESPDAYNTLVELDCDGFQGNLIQAPLQITQNTSDSEFTFQTKALEL